MTKIETRAIILWVGHFPCTWLTWFRSLASYMVPLSPARVVPDCRARSKALRQPDVANPITKISKLLFDIKVRKKNTIADSKNCETSEISPLYFLQLLSKPQFCFPSLDPFISCLRIDHKRDVPCRPNFPAMIPGTFSRWGLDESLPY